MYTKMFTEKEIMDRIEWLETEIDLCLACDLPTEHLVNELNALNKKLIPQSDRNLCYRLIQEIHMKNDPSL